MKIKLTGEFEVPKGMLCRDFDENGDVKNCKYYLPSNWDIGGKCVLFDVKIDRYHKRQACLDACENCESEFKKCGLIDK